MLLNDYLALGKGPLHECIVRTYVGRQNMVQAAVRTAFVGKATTAAAATITVATTTVGTTAGSDKRRDRGGRASWGWQVKGREVLLRVMCRVEDDGYHLVTGQEVVRAESVDDTLLRLSEGARARDATQHEDSQVVGVGSRGVIYHLTGLRRSRRRSGASSARII
jgi:hypothetical protein